MILSLNIVFLFLSLSLITKIYIFLKSYFRSILKHYFNTHDKVRREETMAGHKGTVIKDGLSF